MIRKTIIVLLTLAAVAVGAVWGYSSWPGTPSKLTFWSGTLPRTPAIHYHAAQPEWYILDGQFVVQHPFLVDQTFRQPSAWEVRRVSFRVDLYFPKGKSCKPRYNGLNLAVLNVRFPASAIVVVLSAYPLLALVRSPSRRRRRRHAMGLCVRCEYDLTGNVSGVCPECGTETENP